MMEIFNDLPENADSEVINDRITRLRTEYRDLKKLVESRGFALMEELLLANATTIKLSLSSDHFQEVAEVYKDQFMKGTARGLLRAPQLVQSTAQHYEQELAIMLAKLKEIQNASGNPDSRDDPDVGEPSRGNPEFQPELFDTSQPADEHAP